jgi:predicted permease
VIINFALPAMTVHLLHDFTFARAHLWPVLMPWALFIVGAIVFWTFGRMLGLSRASIGALTLVGGLGNTSFVGLPMIESLHGREGMPLGLLIDQLGSYLVLSTLGVVAVTAYSAEDRPSVRAMAIKVATFPPFVAVVVALLLRPVRFAAEVDGVLARLSDLVAPLALMSVGMQLRVAALREHARPLGLGLAYKLLACPAIVVAVLWLADAGDGMTPRVSVIEAAMPPMIGAGIVAAQAKLDAPLVSTMIGFGIPLGIATAIGWHWVFDALAA